MTRFFVKPFGFLFFALALSAPLAAQDKKVLILRQVSIPTLLEVEKGLLEAIQQGGGGKVSVAVVDLSNQMARVPEALSAGASLVVTIGTRAGVETVKLEKKRPVVFTGVAYPGPVMAAAKGAGLKNVTGTHFANAVEQALSVLKTLKPGVKSVAMMVNQLEPNTKGDGEALAALASKFEVTANLIPYSGEGEFPKALEALWAAKPDLVILPKDTVQIGQAAVLAAALSSHKIAALGLDPTYGDKGAAVLSFTSPAKEVGRLAGAKVIAILSGGNAEGQLVEAPSVKEVVYSAAAARAAGLALPGSLAGQVTRKVE